MYVIIMSPFHAHFICHHSTSYVTIPFHMSPFHFICHHSTSDISIPLHMSPFHFRYLHSIPDGVPISGLWLNATVRGAEGTFVPLGDPVMNDTHLYIMTAFRASSPTGSSPTKTFTADQENSTLLRLYAIDVGASLVKKFTILWIHDTYISGYIPYIDSKGTYCSVTRQCREGCASSGRETTKKKMGESYFPVSLMTMESDRLLVAVRFESAAGTRTFNTSVRDLGRTYSVISSGCTNTSVTSITWGNTDKGTAIPDEYYGLRSIQDKDRNQLQNEGSKFWVSSFFPQKNVTVLEELAELGGPSISGSSITLPTSPTSPLTLLQIAPAPGDSAPTEVLVFGSSGGVSCDMSCDKTPLDKLKRPHAISDTVPLEQYGNVTRGKVSGVRGGKSDCASGNQPHLVAVKTMGGTEGIPNVMWSIPLPHSQPVLGQITTLPLSPHPLLCLTTPRGVYAYTF